MTSDNPYVSPAQLPESPPPQPESQAAGDKRTGAPPPIYTGDTVGIRYAASFLDNFLALALTLVVVKLIGDRWPTAQIVAFLATYWLYFFISEGFTGRTIGKLLTGLVVVGIDGRRCTWRQTLIRTLFRLIEVNPVLLGALPAGISIVVSRNHQRFGDKVAATIVARRARVVQWRRTHLPPAK